MKFTWPWQRLDDASAYKIFTTEFDLTCTGDALTENLSADERAVWHEANASYDEEVEIYRAKASISGAKWMDKLKSDGQVNPEEIAVSILVDHSGSMRGQRAVVACLLVEIVADFLSRAGVAYEILGFTTHSWKGGNSRKKWLARGSRPNPGRLADTLHVVYRQAKHSAPGAPHAIRHLLRGDLLKENIDGEALFWAGQRLMNLGRPRNIVVTISDGAPVDDSTLSANHPSILWDHLKAVIADLEGTPGFKLIGIGIDYDLSGLYPSSVLIDRLNDMADTVFPFLTAQITFKL